jgi:hypothetical protein
MKVGNPQYRYSAGGFNQNFFDPGKQPAPHVPRPKGRPRGAPDLDILFDAQDDIYKAHDSFKKLRRSVDALGEEEVLRDLNRAIDQVGNTARLIRRYLAMHGSQDMFNQEGTGLF